MNEAMELARYGIEQCEQYLASASNRYVADDAAGELRETRAAVGALTAAMKELTAAVAAQECRIARLERNDAKRGY